MARFLSLSTLSSAMSRFLLLLTLPSVISFSFSFVCTTNNGQRTRLAAVKEATFGMGCFWKPSEELLKVPGVIDTVAGYTGNPSETKAPNYDSVCFSPKW
jgi:hypothetical protein